MRHRYCALWFPFLSSPLCLLDAVKASFQCEKDEAHPRGRVGLPIFSMWSCACFTLRVADQERWRAPTRCGWLSVFKDTSVGCSSCKAKRLHNVALVNTCMVHHELFLKYFFCRKSNVMWVHMYVGRYPRTERPTTPSLTFYRVRLHYCSRYMYARRTITCITYMHVPDITIHPCI